MIYSVLRKQEYKLKNIEFVQEERRNFIESDFLAIMNFIESKGLYFSIPTVLSGWDATFIYKQLDKLSYMSDAMKTLYLFLYSRLDRKQPIWIEHKPLFNF